MAAVMRLTVPTEALAALGAALRLQEEGEVADPAVAIHLQRIASDVEREGNAGMGEHRPNRIEVEMPRRFVPRRLVRNPNRLQPEGDDVIQLRERMRN